MKVYKFPAENEHTGCYSYHSINESKQTFKSHIKISECPIEGSINVQIEFLDVNFYISNKGVYTLDVELSFVVLKLRKKCSFPN